MPVVSKEELLASPVAGRDARGLRLRPGSAASCGSPARRPRRCCSSCRRAAERSPPSSTACARASRRRSRTPRTPSSRIRSPSAARGSPSGSSARSRSRWTTSRPRCAQAVDAGAARSGELGAELRRLGAAEVELRQELAAASEAVSAVEVEAARLEAEADEARRRLEQANADEPAEGDDRDQLACDGRAARAPPRDARPGQPARARGVRGREGTARGARRPAGRPRGEPRRAREAPQRADGDGRAPLHRDLRRRPAATSRT